MRPPKIARRQEPHLAEVDKLSTLTRAAADALEICLKAGAGFDRDACVSVRVTPDVFGLTVDLAGALACTDLDILATTANGRFKHLRKQPNTIFTAKKARNRRCYEVSLTDLDDLLLVTPFEYSRLEALESLSLGANAAEVIEYVDPPSWPSGRGPTPAERSRQESAAGRIDFWPDDFCDIPTADDESGWHYDDAKKLIDHLRGKVAPAFEKAGV